MSIRQFTGRILLAGVFAMAAVGCADHSNMKTGMNSSLISAARMGDVASVRALIQSHVNVEMRDLDGDGALHAAAKHGQPEVIRILVREGHANVDARDEDAQTPLHLAAKYGQLEATKALLACGANVNARDKDGWTALHFAARKGSAPVALALLEKGADPNIKNTDDEETPMQEAMDHDSAEVADVLRAHGAKD